MAMNTRIDQDINSPPQRQPLQYADATDESLRSDAGPSRREFLAPGSLLKPAPIGRVVRVLLGLGALSFVYDAIAYRSEVFGSSPPDFYGWYLAIAVGLWVTPSVLNVGLSRRWGDRPRFVVVALLGATIALDLAVYGTIWAPPLGIVLLVWLIPVLAYLGSSFLLAAAVATPGCEMRAVPDLWARLRGRPQVEHACPQLLYNLDAWEQRRRGDGTSHAVEAGHTVCL